MLGRDEVSRGRKARKLAGRTAKSGNRVTGINSSPLAVEGEQRANFLAREAREFGEPIRNAVTFWIPDGSCHEGVVFHRGHGVVFVESKRMVPVGTDVTIRLRSPEDDSTDCGVVEGTVVWQCPTADDFKNREGFGVSVRGRWPRLPGPAETEGTKGFA
ncbi:hypothetical protein [Petrachloros mirabilis]